eukprot:SAG31_NODE_12370_length_946_cov_3.865407_1_plen_214_part_01
MLPRLNAKSKPGTPGHAFMTSPQTISMAQDAANITMRWARATNPDLADTLLRAIDVIPPELRYGDTFWSAVTLVGDLRDGNNHKHKDAHDVVSLIVMVGKDVTDGATLYYNDSDELVTTVPFKHGRYQVCEFDKVAHADKIAPQQWRVPRTSNLPYRPAEAAGRRAHQNAVASSSRAWCGRLGARVYMRTADCIAMHACWLDRTCIGYDIPGQV